MNTRCVIGIGCDDHGDQIAGLLVARRIAALGPDDVAVRESTGAPEQLVAAWTGAGETVITIAAQRFASCAGVSPEVAVAAHRVASTIVDAWSVPATADAPSVAMPAGV